MHDISVASGVDPASSKFGTGGRRFAYVIDFLAGDLRVLDVSGAEVTALMAHSLEAGNLQVRNDVIAQGQLQSTSATLPLRISRGSSWFSHLMNLRPQ